MGLERNISDEVEAYFREVIGMEDAKRAFQLFLDALNFQKIRANHGISEPIVKNKNFIIYGGRGTGKTMLAGTLARFLKDVVLGERYSTETFCARWLNFDDDWSRFINLCAQSQKIVIFDNIDEFLSDPFPGRPEFFRKNAIKLISKTMAERADDIVFIITGSSAGIDSLRSCDPGFENYIFDTIQINNYTAEELWQMMQLMAENNILHIEEGCSGLIKNKLQAQALVAEFLNGTVVEKYKNDAAKRLASNFYAAGGPKGELEEKDPRLVKIDESSIPFKDTSERLQKRLDELDSLTGLELIKKKVKTQLAVMKVAIINEQMGIGGRRNQTLHMIFKGNPGTGKTTVAKIVGDIYCEMGLLPNGDQDVKVVSRAELVGRFVGETAQRVKKVCESADGGVLFIDEAYSLINNEYDSFGHEAVDALIQEMENRRKSMMVILAGYSKEMDEFIKSNPGFKSRIPEANVLVFEDYTSDQMISIFKQIIRADGYEIDPRYVTDEMIRGLIEIKSKNPSFGNARGVRNLAQDVESEVDIRVAQTDRLSDEDKTVRPLTAFERKLVGENDITAVSGKKLQGEKTTEELLKELSELVGLEGVKKQVKDIVGSVEYENILKDKGIEVKGHTKTMHLIFSGNPGTGKSSIATLLGQIYVKLGALKKNTFVLAKRENLVGQYQGHTAAQVAGKVAEADGGILFIDEAYQLCIDEHDTYGMEAIGTLLSLAEEKRDSLMIILAGYSEDMEKFLKTNPGLKSRFPRVIEFEDYNIDELVEIFEYMCVRDGMIVEEGVSPLVKEIIEKRRRNNPKEFGNARGVRNILDEIIIRQNSRIVSDKENIESYSKNDLVTIKKEDVGND